MIDLMARLAMTLFTVLAVAIALPSAAGAVSFAEFPLPAGTTQTGGVSLAPDGGVWTADGDDLSGGGLPGTGQLLRLDRATGTWSAVALPTHAALPVLTFPDGKILFATGKFGRFLGLLDPATRAIRPFADVGQSSHADIVGTTLWMFRGRFGVFPPPPPVLLRITQDGQLAEFPLPEAGIMPLALAAAPDGSVWTVEQRFVPESRTTAVQLAHTLPDGSRAIVPVTINPNALKDVDITVGPDGVVWISTSTGADAVASDILRYAPATGATRSFHIALPGAVTSMVVDPKGRMFYVRSGEPFIINFDPATGTEAAYATPGPRGWPVELYNGRDGAIWYRHTQGVEDAVPSVGRFALDGETQQVDGAVAIAQGLRAGVTCSTACFASARLTVSGTAVRRATVSAAAAKPRTITLGLGTKRLKRAGAGSILVKLTPAGRKRLRAQRTIRARLTVTRKEGGRTRVTRSRVNLVLR